MTKHSDKYAREYDLKNQSPSNVFLFAVYHTVHVLGNQSATLEDVKNFYLEHGISIPSNFGGQIGGLLTKPKKIIKRRNTFILTEFSKRWISSFLSGGRVPTPKVSTRQDYLDKSIGDIDIDKLVLTTELKKVILERIVEVKKCMDARAPLAVIFLCGSTLEGLLLSYATRHPATMNAAAASPKDRTTGRVLPLKDWKLSALIDVTKEIGLIDEDTSKFSSSMREFRNYIHPNQQVTKKFSPTMATAEICFKVLQSAIVQLEGK